LIDQGENDCSQFPLEDFPSFNLCSSGKVNYIGSKYSLLPFIDEITGKVLGGEEKIFCDLFAGTGAVGRHFKRKGFQVIANDIQYYAYVLNKAYLEINHPPRFTNLRKVYGAEMAQHRKPFAEPIQEVFGFVNSLRGKAGFIVHNYSPVGNRFYYTPENAEKADTIRQALEQWRADKIINRHEFFYILCALLEAIDQVANTASVYGAYLKTFKKSARRELWLKPLKLVNHVEGCKAFNEDANQLVKKIKCDVLYLDPPYNHRQYGANYHVLETIAAYDAPQLNGVTGMRDYPRSLYCRKKTAREAMKNVIEQSCARHILVSYNDEGILSLEEVQDLLRLRGEPEIFQTGYNRFKADNNRQYKRSETVEYLHYVRVSKS
jgi:adenine-specific DNA-methyltransferase